MIGGLSVRDFIVRHELSCPAAQHRLLEIGVPATTVQHYITSMDAVKLGMVAVDQIQPLLNDLLVALIKIPNLPPNFVAKEKARQWLTVLHAMRASDELDEVWQILFDLETGYNEFHRSLSSSRTDEQFGQSLDFE
ncbi:VPS28 protein-domain-containing protein [Pavlovales sp. CCMP2436]|nr:VPS28 protein-domain-containing protein [Pavlovales sp. CCMP2436]